MKKICLVIFFLSLSLLKAQTGHNISPGGILDTIFDKDGRKYALANLKADTNLWYAGSPGSRTLITCTTGYFKLFFDPNSGMAGTSTTETDRRNVICQLFSDISTFIPAPAGTPLATGGAYVNILVNDFAQMVSSPSTSGIAGIASSFYSMPSGSTATGIVDNQIWRTINAGNDAYIGVAPPLSISMFSNSYYHGTIAINTYNPAIYNNWHTTLTTSASGTELDLYTVALHEVTHALGFATLIDYNGISRFGTVYPYYSRYDLFLKTQGGTPLITNTGSCSLYGFGWNTGLNAINTLSPHTATCGGTPPTTAFTNSTTCSTAINYVGGYTTTPVYTQDCYIGGSQLSHFEDGCYPSGSHYGSGTYFVMSAMTGLGNNKRHLTVEEKNVLCDLGYKTTSTYGNNSVVSGSYANYTTGCSGNGVAGINDGINSSGTYAYTGVVNNPVAITSILTNDYGATSYECLQVVIGTGTLSATSGTGTFSYTPTATGVNVLRYIPVASSGKRGNITYIIVYSQVSSNCTSSSCNLVNNGNFEQLTTAGVYPSNYSEITKSCGWDQANSNGAGADFYHSSCPTVYVKVPCNNFGYEPDNLGLNAYAGFRMSENIYSKLSSSLTANTAYRLTFDASLAEGMSAAGYPIQVYLQNNYIPATTGSTITVSNPSMLFTPAQITNYTGWTPVSITFTTGATSGENYIVLGNLTNTVVLTPQTAAPSNLNGCTIYPGPGFYDATNSYMYVDNIKLVPLSAVSSFTPPSPLCLNQPIILNNYVTVPNGTFTGSGVTCSSGTCTFTPSSVGTGTYAIVYTYTNNLGCQATATANIAVTSTNMGTVTASANPTFICSPSNTTTLTASGATSYTWSPGSVLSCTACATTVGTITNTTNFYVTATNSVGCIVTNTVNVSYNATPTVAISPSSANICWGTSQTFTASGATTYTWSANAGSATTSTVTVSPTVNTTYTVTGANGSCTATKTVSVTIQSNVCTGTVVASPTITSTYTISPAFVSTNITVPSGVNWTLSSSEVRMAPGVSITVASGGTLTVNGSWIHACASCSGSMWQGIIVNNNAKVVMSGYNIIEDAVQAVYTASSTTATPIPTAQIQQTIFNKNGTDIYVDTHVGNLSANYVYNTIFTCRSLGSHTISSANFSAIKSDIAVSTPLIPSTTNPTTVTLAGTRSQYAIYLNQVANTAGINIGNSAQANNLFDYSDFGIFSALTPIIVKNNTFQNMMGNSNSGNPSGAIGVGVYINGSSFEVGSPTSIIGNATTTVVATEKNYFTNCLRGVMTISMNNLFVNNNTFNNETTATTFTTSGSYVTGEYGVISTGFAIRTNTLTPGEQMQYANNTCNNFATAYFLDMSKLYNPTSKAIYFYNNVIGSAATSSRYCNYGIYMQQSNTFGANTGVPQDMVSVTTNSITNVNTSCVSVNSVNNSTTAGFVTINQNTELSLRYQNFGSLQSPPVAAVGVYNSYYTKVSDNTLIKCTGLSSYPSTNSQNLAGVYVKNSPNCTINCNTTSYIGEGFVWEGGSPNSTWRSNAMPSGQYGLVLRNNGYMSNQGAVGNSIRDSYGNTGLVKGHTLSDHSDPTNGATPAAMYVSNLGYSCPTSATVTTIELPCVNTATNVATAYSTTSLPPGLIVTGNNGTSPCVSGGGGGGGQSPISSGSMISSTTSTSSSTSLQSLTASSPTLASYDYETRWANQYYVSNADPTIAAASGYANAKSFAQADAAFVAGNYSQAQTIISGITPVNTIENNWLQVNQVLLNLATIKNYALSSADIINLQNVAQQCPAAGGNIVYRSRAALNAFYKRIIEYPGSCQITTGNRLAHSAEGGSSNNSVNDVIKLYPNPNNGTMTVEYSVSNNAVLEITDINGKSVCKYNLPASATSLDINNDKLENGVYFYHITDGTSLSKSGKVIIMK